MALERYAAQEALFAKAPSRVSILRLPLPGLVSGKTVKANVWRNHAFEPIEPLFSRYAEFGGWAVDFQFSDYDDSLSFHSHAAADLELLWLDSSRYSSESGAKSWVEWLLGRIHSLRLLTSSPIVVATWIDDEARPLLQANVDEIPSVFFADIAAACKAENAKLLDMRTKAVAGTPLGGQAQVVLARKLACHWLPGVLFPPVKALALDLDNTLHIGVLGEDGIQGMQLTSGHRELQEFLKAQRDRGVFLTLISRNDPDDVEALFRDRVDYPLRLSDFSVIEVSWRNKSLSILRVAESLRISPDAILFVDDNPGELATVANMLEAPTTVFASTDASTTKRSIEYFPGLWRWKVLSDDTKRIDDLNANKERQRLYSEIPDSAEYFRFLGVSLTIRYDRLEQLTRLSDLCAKTNQFNLALRRFGQGDIAHKMYSPDACVASVQMTDRLCDSGVIAVVIAEVREGRLVVEELCISCRALGRQLEDTIIFEALRGMPVFGRCDAVAFQASEGPRNQPALSWLERQTSVLDRKSGCHVIPMERVVGYKSPDGVGVLRDVDIL